MLGAAVAAVAGALLAACSVVEQVREEPWRMGQTPFTRYTALYDEHYQAGLRAFYRKDYATAVASFREAHDAAERLRLNEERHGRRSPLARSMAWNALRGLGTTHAALGELAEAETCHRQALALGESIRRPDGRFLGDSLNDLAVVHRKQARHDEALVLLERAARVFEDGGNRFDLAVVLNNTGHVYAAQGRTTDAETSFERALAVTEGAMGRRSGPDDPGWFPRIVQLKDYAAAVRKGGRDHDAERLEARLNALLGEERTHVAALRERGQREAADFREARLRDILSASAD